MKIVIFGSCVSRDGFELLDKGEFSLVGYFARSSLGSAFSERLVSDVDISAISSQFQRRMVESDLRKDFKGFIESKDFDCLLYDPIDERFDLLVMDGGGICTASNEFKSAGDVALSKAERRIASGSDEFFSNWEAGWSSLIELLGRLGKRSNLLVNRVFWSDSTESGEDFLPNYPPNKIARENEFLERIYSRMALDIGADQFLNFGRNFFVGSDFHKWGKSPFHYCQGYYLMFRDYFARLASSREENKGASQAIRACSHGEGGSCENAFRVSCWYGEGDVLHVSAFAPVKFNPEYAFYVFLDGEKVASRWYGEGVNVIFKLPECDYKRIKVVAFCKYDGGRVKKVLTPSYLFGSISDGFAVVAVYSQGPDVGKKLRFFDEVGSAIEMEPVDALGGFLGYIKKSRVRIPRDHHVEFFRSKAVLPACGGVFFRHTDFLGASFPWAKDRLSLEVLYTPTEDLFGRAFTFASSRHYSPEVVLRIAKNNLSDLEVLDRIYINSAVVYLYKSMELEFSGLDFSFMDEVSRRAMRLVEKAKHGGSVRSDKVQLALSVLVARIHFLFLQRRYDDVVACALLASKFVIDYGFRDSYSLNLSKANFFALGVSHFMRDFEARDYFVRNVMDVRVVLDDFLRSNKTEWLVSESRYVYALADFAVAISEGNFSEDVILEGLREASRVKTADYLSVIDGLVVDNE